VTVFDDKPDDALFEQLSRERRDTLGLTGPTQAPDATVYEIAAGV
jgi:hypothetical protein